MFRCPNCNTECPTYDEVRKTCMYNTKLIDPEEAYAQWSNPEACFDELD